MAARRETSARPANARPTTDSTRRIRALCVWGLSAAAVLGALAGLLVSSLWTIFFVAPVAGVAVASLVAIENHGFPTDPCARRVVFFAGCGGALLVPLVDGIVWLGGLGVPVMAVGLGVGVLAGLFVDPERQAPPHGA